MNWLVAENELDYQQREFLKALEGNPRHQWIQGFPGSGKTIMLLYAAKRLRELHPEAEILFVEFTHSLIKMLRAAIDQLPYKDIQVVTYYDFMDHATPLYKYDYILCDEVQDIPMRVLDLIRMSAHHVILAGDSTQSIYTKDPQWGEPVCTSDQIQTIFHPEITRLNIIHRLTKPVIRAIHAFMPELRFAFDHPSMVKKNVQIRLWRFRSPKEEVGKILEEATLMVKEGKSVGILFAHHRDVVRFANQTLVNAHRPRWKKSRDRFGNCEYDKMNDHLKENHIPIQYLANGWGSFFEGEGKITLTTYHSSKGLDFDTVFLPFCEGEFDEDSPDHKTLFMVAMSRSRENLFISYSGIHVSRLVRAFAEECNVIDWTNEDQGSLFDAVNLPTDDFGFFS